MHVGAIQSIVEEIKQEENTLNGIFTISMGMQLVKTCKKRFCFLFKYFSVVLSTSYLNVVSVS